MRPRFAPEAARRGNALLVATIVLSLAAVVVVTSTDRAVVERRTTSVELRQSEVLAALEVVLARRQQQVIDFATNRRPEDFVESWPGQKNYGVDFVGSVQVRWKIEPVHARGITTDAGTDITNIAENPPPGGLEPPITAALPNRKSFYLYRVAAEARYDSRVTPDATNPAAELASIQPNALMNDVVSRAQGVRYVVTPNESALNYLLFYALRGPKADLELSHGPRLSLVGDIYTGGALYLGSGTASNDWSALRPANATTEFGPNASGLSAPYTPVAALPDWTTSVTYDVGAIVKQGSSIFQCKAGHVASLGLKPGTTVEANVFWHDVTVARVVAVDGVYCLSKQVLYGAINGFPMLGTAPAGWPGNDAYRLDSAIYPGENDGDTASYRPPLYSASTLFDATWGGTTINPARAGNLFATRDPSASQPMRLFHVASSSALPTAVPMRGIDESVALIGNDSRDLARNSNSDFTWKTGSMQPTAPGFNKQVRTLTNGGGPEELAKMFLGRPDEPQKLRYYELDGDLTTDEHEYAQPLFIQATNGGETTELADRRQNATHAIDAIEVPGKLLGDALGGGWYLGRRSDYTGWIPCDVQGVPLVDAGGTRHPSFASTLPSDLGLIIRERPLPHTGYFPTPNPAPGTSDPLYMPYAYGHVRNSLWPFLACDITAHGSALYSGEPYPNTRFGINTARSTQSYSTGDGGKVSMTSACNPGPSHEDTSSAKDFVLKTPLVYDADGYLDTKSSYRRFPAYHQDAWRFVCLTPPKASDTAGLQVTYWNDRPNAASRYAGPLGRQPLFRGTATDINVSWSAAPPGATGIGADYFSVRWQGFVVPQYSENYTFLLGRTGVGARLWVNERLLIDQWVEDSGTTSSSAVALSANQHTLITVELFDKTGSAGLDLRWSSRSQAEQTIPADRFRLPQSSDAAVRQNSGLDPNTFASAKVRVTLPTDTSAQGRSRKAGLMLRAGSGLGLVQDGRDPYLVLAYTPNRGVFVQYRGERAEATSSGTGPYFIGSGTVTTGNTTINADPETGEIGVNAGNPEVTRIAALVPSHPTLLYSATNGTNRDIKAYVPGKNNNGVPLPPAPSGVSTALWPTTLGPDGWPTGAGRDTDMQDALNQVRITNPFSGGTIPENNVDRVYKGIITTRTLALARRRSTASYSAKHTYRLTNLVNTATQLFRWKPGDDWTGIFPLPYDDNANDGSRRVWLFPYEKTNRSIRGPLPASASNNTYAQLTFGTAVDINYNVTSTGQWHGAILTDISGGGLESTGDVYWYDQPQPDVVTTHGDANTIWYINTTVDGTYIDTRPRAIIGGTQTVISESRVQELCALQWGGVASDYPVKLNADLPTWPSIGDPPAKDGAPTLTTVASIPFHYPGFVRLADEILETRQDITVSGGTGAGNYPFGFGDVLAISSSNGYELVQVVDQPAGSTGLTVQRGVHGTTALRHPAGSLVSGVMTPMAILSAILTQGNNSPTVPAIGDIRVGDYLTLQANAGVGGETVKVDSTTPLRLTRAKDGIARDWMPTNSALLSSAVLVGKLSADVATASIDDTGILPLAVIPVDHVFTTIPDPSGSAPMGVGSLIQIDSEILAITSINQPGSTLTVKRGQLNTTPSSHAANSQLALLAPRTFAMPRARTITQDLHPFMSAGGMPHATWRQSNATRGGDLGWFWSGVGAFAPWKSYWGEPSPQRSTGGFASRVVSISDPAPSNSWPNDNVPSTGTDDAYPPNNTVIVRNVATARWTDDQPARWVQGINYAAGDMVFHNNKIHKALTSHQATNSNSPSAVPVPTPDTWDEVGDLWLRFVRHPDPDRFLVRVQYSHSGDDDGAWFPVRTDANVDANPSNDRAGRALATNSNPTTSDELVIDLTAWFRGGFTTLNRDLVALPTDMDLTVASTTGFRAGDVLRIDDELVRVATNPTSSTRLTVVRAVNGTLAEHRSGVNVAQQRYRGPDLLIGLATQSGSYNYQMSAEFASMEIKLTNDTVINDATWASSQGTSTVSPAYLASQYQAFWGPWDITESFFKFIDSNGNACANEEWIYDPREFWSQSRWWEDGTEKDPGYVLPSNPNTLSNRELMAKSTILDLDMHAVQEYLRTTTYGQALDPIIFPDAGPALAPALTTAESDRPLLADVREDGLIMHASRTNRYPWNPNLNGANPWNPALPNDNPSWKTNAELEAMPLTPVPPAQSRASVFAAQTAVIRANNLRNLTDPNNGSLTTAQRTSLFPYTIPSTPTPGAPSKAPAFKPQEFHHAVMLSNADSIFWGYNGGDDFGASKTMIVVPNRLFFCGDFNTVAHNVSDGGVATAKRTPVAVFCDTPIFLSNAWQWSANHPFQRPGLTASATGTTIPTVNDTLSCTSLPGATSTAYACALLTHNQPTTRRTVLMGEASSVINTMLFLENWNNRTFTLNGSIVVMDTRRYSSAYLLDQPKKAGLGPFGWMTASGADPLAWATTYNNLIPGIATTVAGNRWGGAAPAVYGAPNRLLFYNPDFKTKEGTPPQVPFGIKTVGVGGWVRLIR